MSTVRPLVFIGCDNSPGEDGSDATHGNGAYPNLGAIRQFTDGGAAAWQWVLQNVDGWYFALQQFHSREDSWMSTIQGWLKNKNAFVETDFKHSTGPEDAAWMNKVASYGFTITAAALNKNDGYDSGARCSQDRIDTLRQRCNGPVLEMCGPFTADDGAQSWPEESKCISRMDGSATDGPMGLWHGPHGMPGRTRQTVYYAHGLSLKAMVMLSPLGCTPGSPSSSFLGLSQEAVRWLETLPTGSASPDIWTVSYYDAKGHPYPVKPEKHGDGTPADTVTGVAYWLINHLRDPVNWP
jgi:hypothetical protein